MFDLQYFPLLIMFIGLCFYSNSALEVKEFGIYTHENEWAGTDGGAVNLYLWFNQYLYYCTINPIESSTIYSCNADSWTTMNRKCDEPSYSLLIHSPNENMFMVDKLFVTLNNNTWYGIDKFCITDSSLAGPNYAKYFENIGYDYVCPPSSNQHLYVNGICIDTEIDECGPEKVIFDFDINSPNKWIENAVWGDGSGIIVPPEACDPTALSPIQDSGCKWTLIYEHDKNGNRIYGSYEQLVEDIRNGKDLRVVYNDDHVLNTFMRVSVKLDHVEVLTNTFTGNGFHWSYAFKTNGNFVQYYDSSSSYNNDQSNNDQSNYYGKWFTRG